MSITPKEVKVLKAKIKELNDSGFDITYNLLLSQFIRIEPANRNLFLKILEPSNYKDNVEFHNKYHNKIWIEIVTGNQKDVLRNYVGEFEQLTPQQRSQNLLNQQNELNEATRNGNDYLKRKIKNDSLNKAQEKEKAELIVLDSKFDDVLNKLKDREYLGQEPGLESSIKNTYNYIKNANDRKLFLQLLDVDNYPSKHEFKKTIEEFLDKVNGASLIEYRMILNSFNYRFNALIRKQNKYVYDTLFTKHNQFGLILEHFKKDNDHFQINHANNFGKKKCKIIADLKYLLNLK